MEGRRRQKEDNYRRPVQSKKPPRVSWQPIVPLWEKDFCRVVGSLDWETLVQMKKFTHLYSDVMNWNDSAGKEAFQNAKKRYWAEINCMSCDIPLPDPGLYIDKIDWDSEPKDEIELLRDIECKSVIPDTEDGHDPVVIFGDSLFPNQAFSPAGWGDIDDKNFDAPVNQSSGSYVNSCSMMLNQAIPSTDWGGDCEQNNYGDRSWGNSLSNGTAPAWPVYSDNTWQFSGSTRYMSWGTDWGWTYGNNRFNYESHDKRGNGQHVQLRDHNRNYMTTRGDAAGNSGGNRGQHRAPDCRTRPGVDKKSPARKWTPISSCGPVGHGTGITVGRAWNE